MSEQKLMGGAVSPILCFALEQHDFKRELPAGGKQRLDLARNPVCRVEGRNANH